MAKVLIVEQEDGRIGFFDPHPNEYEDQTRDEYLTTYADQEPPIITHGSIEESSIPVAPTGGNQNHLFWNDSALAYDTTAITDAKRVDLNNQVGALFTEKEASIQVTVDSVVFTDGDRMKQNLGLLAGVVANGGAIPVGAKIRQADGIRVNLTAQLHIDLSDALALAHSDLLNALEDHLDAIAAANDAALDIYDVDLGWP